MFLNMSYSANSCSHYIVSNASTKVTKKSKHTNNNQNITTNSKATFTYASPWHNNTLLLQHNHKLIIIMFGIIVFFVLCLNVLGTMTGGSDRWGE